ncbi:regulatory protein [Clostridium sp. DSM 8431]|uniref:recombination regulator RecX n=1 Tax=Clostridium sp. DSM 8431 TaxID=1761781 RepID=UPI0008F12D00|nr:recombination regulator RecX [Clostridium sp. DSM 8431]SFU73658.1 regulatory protein [Clostridium sp. DSM 8431]
MGKITKIESQKRNKDRVNVYIDNNYAFSAYMELVYKESLKVNSEVDEEKLLRIAKKENLSKCKESALRIIERSYKTEKEMIQRLNEKGFDSENIAIVIDFLKEYNFINDTNYAKMYIKDKLSSQGMQKIKYSLLRKGITSDVIEEIMSNMDDNKQMDTALELARKKYNSLLKTEKDKYKLWNKLLRYLVGRGYDYSMAKDVIKEVMDNID